MGGADLGWGKVSWERELDLYICNFACCIYLLGPAGFSLLN